MKSKLNKKNVFILFILQNKLRFAEYQLKLQKKNDISTTVRLTMSIIITQSSQIPELRV